MTGLLAGSVGALRRQVPRPESCAAPPDLELRGCERTAVILHLSL